MFRVPILLQKVANISFYSSPRPLKTNDYMTEQNVLHLKKCRVSILNLTKGFPFYGVTLTYTDSAHFEFGSAS